MCNGFLRYGLVAYFIGKGSYFERVKLLKMSNLIEAAYGKRTGKEKKRTFAD